METLDNTDVLIANSGNGLDRENLIMNRTNDWVHDCSQQILTPSWLTKMLLGYVQQEHDPFPSAIDVPAPLVPWQSLTKLGCFAEPKKD